MCKLFELATLDETDYNNRSELEMKLLPCVRPSTTESRNRVSLTFDMKGSSRESVMEGSTCQALAIITIPNIMCTLPTHTINFSHEADEYRPARSIKHNINLVLPKRQSRLQT